MSENLQSIQTGVTMNLQAKIARGKSLRGWIDRVAYPQYQNLQRERWMTEGASQGTSWPSLNPKYEKYKARKFASFPGGGTKMMIATSRLFNSVIGDDLENHRKIATDTSLEVFSTLDYAQYPNVRRNFTDFSQATMEDLANQAAQYIMGGGS